MLGMKMSRILALVLAVLTAAALLSGCGGEEEPDPTETTTVTTTTTTIETTTTEAQFTLEGYSFTFVGAHYSGRGSALWYNDPGTAGQQEIMDAYLAIQNEYGCTITNINYPSEEKLFAAFTAGDKVGDFIYVEDDIFGASVVKGYVRRLDTDEVRAVGMNVLDPEQFDNVSVKTGLLGGEAYICRITNETLYAQTGRFYCFNKTMTAAAGYPAEVIYQAVRDYTWTWDVLIDICHAGAVYNDETGLYDIAGVSRVFTNPELATMCNGLVYWDGERYVSGISEISTLTALNTVVTRLIMDPSVMFTIYLYGSVASRQYFYDQRTLFGAFDNLNDPYACCDFPYGVVPMPRGGTVGEYVSLLTNFQGYICQTANEDWEKACAIMGLIGDALNRPEESALYLESMTHDAESIEMLENYIQPNIKLDVSGFCSEAWDIFWNDIRGGMRAGMTAAQAVAENKEAFEQALDEYWGEFNDR